MTALAAAKLANDLHKADQVDRGGLSGKSEAHVGKIQKLIERLEDRRSKKVVFLSHCILNENTRYLGGACTGGCLQQIVEQCLAEDAGIVQMPCPEQYAWGGVTKRLLLRAYGAKGTPLYRFHRVIVPLLLMYTRFVYQRIAKQTAAQIEDYLTSGFSVLGVVGIDGSPSCGVAKTLDLWRSLDLTASIDSESITVAGMNSIIRECLTNGSGLFVNALRKELERRQVDVPFLAHDLIAELDGERPDLKLWLP